MIVNLTQHLATADQIAAGVVDLPAEERTALCAALTFAECPDPSEVIARAEEIAEIAAMSDLYDTPSMDTRAMIGGALWLMAPLARALRERGFEPVFAFSRRETVEEAQPDGSVRKVARFAHAGWVPA